MGRLPRRGEPAHGIRAKISSWQRVSPNIVPHVSKATGVYLNSMLAVTEANNAGYDEAILLSPEGTVADGSGENIFVVRDGVHLHPRSRDRDPARDHARQRQADRAGPRLHGRREVDHPLRPLPRRRGVHVRHRGRGDAAPLDRRPRDRRRRDHARDPAGVPRDGARQERALVALARPRPAARARAERACATARPHQPQRAMDRRARRGARARGAALGLAVARADRARASRRCSPTPSGRRTAPPSRRARRGSTSACTSPASARATR